MTLEIFSDAACKNAVTTWKEADGYFTVSYNDTQNGKTAMTVEMTAKGLAEINNSPGCLYRCKYGQFRLLSTVRKYTRAKKLTPRMLNELVNHIEVHQAEKINGEWVQKLTIYYNCVGALLIPDTPSMPWCNCPEGTRTPDLLIRSQSLYPTELLAHTHFSQMPEYSTTSLKKNASAFSLFPTFLSSLRAALTASVFLV